MGMEINCKICSSTNTELYKRNSKEFIFCKKCGFFFLKDYPSEKTYASNFEQDTIMSAKEYLRAEHRRIFRIAGQLEFLSEIYQYKRPPASILDYGCGRGYFLDEARRHGYTVAGIEISLSAIYYCGNVGIPVYKKLNEVKTKFDVIVMYNSLVKTPNPMEAMLPVKEKMNENGLLFIKVPYTRSKYWKLFQTADYQFFKQVYLQHFTIKSMKLLLEKSGFEILEIKKTRSRKKYNRRMLNLATKIFNEYYNLKIPFTEKLKRMFFDTFKKEISVVARLK
ncbi:MAG: class I SAM-dependent methyltransferase [bacterium]